jgi:endonuclease/exonuclease/phosphatase family metal-dependent hydrolase
VPFLALLVLLIALLLSLGSSPGTSVRAADTDGFTVMTFNVQHGLNPRGRYNLGRVADLIGTISPDIVGLQETTRNHPKFDCDDQPQALAESLSRKTGRTWSHVYQQEWFTPDVSCRDRGAGDGKETEGLTVLSPHAIERVAHTDLWNTRIGLAVRVRAIGDVPIVVTHLASGTKGREDRHKQVGPLLGWARGLGSPRILIGDLNMAADADELQPVLKDYKDAWTEAAASGTTRGVTSGNSRVGKAGRIDYIFFTPGKELVLDWVETVDSARLVGEAVSDHQPVVAHFHITGLRRSVQR